MVLRRAEYRRGKILERLQTKSKPTSARELAKDLGFGFSARDVGRQLAILNAEGRVKKTCVTYDGVLWEVAK